MKIGVITDMYSNVIALNATLETVQRTTMNIDSDIVCYGHTHNVSFVVRGEAPAYELIKRYFYGMKE